MQANAQGPSSAATGATTAKSYDEMLKIQAKQKAEQETMEDAAKAVEAGVDPAVANLHATIKSLYRCPAVPSSLSILARVITVGSRALF